MFAPHRIIPDISSDIAKVSPSLRHIQYIFQAVISSLRPAIFPLQTFPDITNVDSP